MSTGNVTSYVLHSQNWTWSDKANWNDQWKRINPKIRTIAMDIKQAPVIEYFLNEATNIADVILYASVPDEVLSHNSVRGTFDHKAPFNITFENIKFSDEHCSKSYTIFNDRHVVVPDQILLKSRLRNVEEFYFDIECEEDETKVRKGTKGQDAEAPQFQRPNLEVRAMQSVDYCVCRRAGKADEVVCTTCTNRKSHKIRGKKERKYGKIMSRTLIFGVCV